MASGTVDRGGPVDVIHNANAKRIQPHMRFPVALDQRRRAGSQQSTAQWHTVSGLRQLALVTVGYGAGMVILLVKNFFCPNRHFLLTMIDTVTIHCLSLGHLSAVCPHLFELERPTCPLLHPDL